MIGSEDEKNALLPFLNTKKHRILTFRFSDRIQPEDPRRYIIKFVPGNGPKQQFRSNIHHLIFFINMNIQFVSDLHLEFPENKSFLTARPLIPSAEILLMAGDIVPFGKIMDHDDFFDYISDHFEMVYWVPGNHEYYHYDIKWKPQVISEKIRSNVRLVNNISVLQGDTRLLFTTLWSRIDPTREMKIEKSLMDFRLIQFRRNPFTSFHFNELHQLSMDFLAQELSRKHQGKTIVVSHHVPTFQNYPAQYQDSILNEAFAVELKHFIEENKPDYWIYGHHHTNTPDFRIGQTRLLTNQLGYITLGENHGFNPARTI